VRTADADREDANVRQTSRVNKPELRSFIGRLISREWPLAMLRTCWLPRCSQTGE
jgi:hypothetical protein